MVVAFISDDTVTVQQLDVMKIVLVIHGIGHYIAVRVRLYMKSVTRFYGDL